jgi:hypothetical protein
VQLVDKELCPHVEAEIVDLDMGQWPGRFARLTELAKEVRATPGHCSPPAR